MFGLSEATHTLEPLLWMPAGGTGAVLLDVMPAPRSAAALLGADGEASNARLSRRRGPGLVGLQSGS
jgi:hypothetical protein